MDEFHFAVKRPSGLYHRACNSRKRYRAPNEDTDTTAVAEVTCLRCRGTRAYKHAASPPIFTIEEAAAAANAAAIIENIKGEPK